MGYKTHGLKYLSLSPIKIRPEYAVWSSMKARCLNPNCQQYHNYGGRGIKVCDQWLVFETFFADMGERPSSKHSLGRQNNDGNYEPGNCRWETKDQQDNNKRTNTYYTLNDKTMTLKQWADFSGLSISTLWHRIQSKWPLELAINKVNKNKNSKAVDEELAERMLLLGRSVAVVARYFEVTGKVITPIRERLGIPTHKNQHTAPIELGLAVDATKEKEAA